MKTTVLTQQPVVRASKPSSLSLRRPNQFWRKVSSSMLGASYLLGCLLSENAKAQNITAITNPAANMMGNGVAYTADWERAIADGFDLHYFIKFVTVPEHPAIYAYDLDSDADSVFLRGDTADTLNLPRNRSHYATWYGEWDTQVPITPISGGFLLRENAVVGSDNWMHYVYNDQYVWAQFQMSSADISVADQAKAVCITYAFSQGQDFSLQQARAAVAEGTVSYWTGGASDWGLSGNWSYSVPSTNVGGYVDNGGTARIGNSNVVDVSKLVLGSSAGSSGHVEIQRGGTLMAQSVAVGRDGTGSLEIQGDASADELVVGHTGQGTVIVSDGGELTSTGAAFLGNAAGSTGEVTVTGIGSTASFNTLVVGKNGTGKLSVLDGGSVSTADDWESFLVGGGSGSGEVLISGIGSTITAPKATEIGYLGDGTLTLQEGGSLVTSRIDLAQTPDVTGTLNFGSYDLAHATKAGSTTATSITLFVRDGNNPTVNFNQYDTNTISAAFTARGTINQRGSGTTILTGDNSGYYGTTNVTNGTLHVKNSLGGHTIVSGSSTLIAKGQFENVTLNDGTTLVVGDGAGNPALMTITGELVFEKVVQMQLFIQGTGVGEYSQIFANTIEDGAVHDAIILLDLRFVAGFIPELNDSFQIFTGALPDSDFVAIDLQQPLPEGLYWNTTNLGVDGTVFITNTQAVPEPGTYALLGLSAVFAIWAYRRRAEASV